MKYSICCIYIILGIVFANHHTRQNHLIKRHNTGHWTKMRPIRKIKLTHNVSVCYSHLGCVNITYAWYHKNCRTVNLLPQERFVVNTKFMLLSPCGLSGSTIVFDLISTNPDTINITKFDPKLPLILLIHDFTSNGYTGWIKELAIVLFKDDLYNVMSVDWQQGAEAPFDQAIANARLVALECIALLNMLKENFDLRMQRVYIIGHGVGAHIAGYIGKGIKDIGRITGLDPTGPKFDCMVSCAKLTSYDALFVDVLHTDGKGYYRQGTLQPMGNLDYYFNDGHHQPGCREDLSFRKITNIKRCELPKGQILPGCSHKRVLKYFIEAVNSTSCEFIGFRANCYKEFLLSPGKNCHDEHDVNCAAIRMNVLPAYAKQRNAKLYLRTGSSSPYCLSVYIVNLNLGCNPNTSYDKTRVGMFKMLIQEAETNKISNISFNDMISREIHPGENETFIAYGTNQGIDYMSKVLITWKPRKKIWCPLCTTYIYLQNLTITRLKSAGRRHEITNEFCKNKNQVKLKSNSPEVFCKCQHNNESINLSL